MNFQYFHPIFSLHVMITSQNISFQTQRKTLLLPIEPAVRVLSENERDTWKAKGEVNKKLELSRFYSIANEKGICI